MASYQRVNDAGTGNFQNYHGNSFELEELASLATSDNSSESSRSISDRGLTPIASGEFDDTLQHHRSASISLMNEDWYHLTATIDELAGSRLEKLKKLSYLHGLALVIGLQIGSGIFASPNQVNEHAGSVGASLIVWTVAGLLAWTGASSFAELGSAIPLNGSSQAYLNHIFGALPSFLFSWTCIIILKPGSAAIVSIIFAEYLGRGLGGDFATSYWVQKAIALLALSAITALNCFSTKLGAHAGFVFLVIKISMLLAIAIIGAVNLVTKHSAGALISSPDHKGAGSLFEGSSRDLGDYAIALYAGLWAYDGWDNVNYVSAEMRDATRDLPKVIHTAMPTVIIAYIATNLAYYSVLTESDIKNATSVALSFVQMMFHSKTAVILFAVLISISCIGSLNASIFSSARLVYASAEEGFLPKMFAQVNARRGTPINAFLLQSALTTGFILVGEFDSLLTFYGVAGYMFYFLTVFGVIVLRFREPALERPYKTYITTPIMFCCVALFLVSRTLFEKPVQSMFVGVFIVAGVVVFYIVRPWPGWVSRLGSKVPGMANNGFSRLATNA